MFKSIILSLVALTGVSRTITPTSYTQYGTDRTGIYYAVTDTTGYRSINVNQNLGNLETFSMTIQYDDTDIQYRTNLARGFNNTNCLFSYVGGYQSVTPSYAYDSDNNSIDYSFTGLVNGVATDTFVSNSFGLTCLSQYSSITLTSSFLGLRYFVSFTGYTEDSSSYVRSAYLTGNVVLGENEQYHTGVIGGFNAFGLGLSYDDFNRFNINIVLVANNDNVTESYDNGYDQGYQTGYTEGNSTGFDNGYNTGYNVGFENGANSGNSFIRLLFAIADTPIYYLRSLFNVSIFGFNVAAVVLGLLTSLIIIWVVKRFI